MGSTRVILSAAKNPGYGYGIGIFSGILHSADSVQNDKLSFRGSYEQISLQGEELEKKGEEKKGGAGMTGLRSGLHLPGTAGGSRAAPTKK